MIQRVHQVLCVLLLFFVTIRSSVMDRYVGSFPKMVTNKSYYCACSDPFALFFGVKVSEAPDEQPVTRQETCSHVGHTLEESNVHVSTPLRTRTSFQFRKEALMDKQKIRKDLLAWQCSSKRCGECLHALNCNEEVLDFAVENVSRMRERTFKETEQKVAVYIRQQLTTLLRLSPSTLQYVVSGVQACKQAWTWAHGFSTATSNRVHAAFNKWWQTANPQVTDNKAATSVGLPQQTVDFWVYKWLVFATHNPPNGGTPSVPKLGASVLYPQYKAWCARAKEHPVTEDNFRSRVSLIKKDLEVATRKSKQGSAECDICSLLKRAEAKVISLSQKKQINTLLAEHIDFTNTECAVYFQHGFDAKDNPGQVC